MRISIDEYNKVKRESLDWQLLYQDAVVEIGVWENEFNLHRAEIVELKEEISRLKLHA